MPGLTPPAPPVPVKTNRKRRVRLWGSLIGIALAILLLALLAPFLAGAALIVLITAIVAVVKKTPTWLRFRGPGSATAAIAVSAVVLVVASMVATAGDAARSEPDADAVDPAPRFVAVEPTSDPPPPTEPEPAPSAPPNTAPAVPVAAGTALALLDTLEVKGRAPKTGYSRDQFGQRWRDVDRNGCDSRNDVLARDLTDVVRSGPCKVTSGTLMDPYTGAAIAFVRGEGTSELVQIDHVVALSDAWQKGAQQLTAHERELFANDPLNLLAVDGTTNQRKGDSDAATWLPPAKDVRCAYVARQVSVKAVYRLWVTQAEHDAIARILAGCPDEPALVGDDATAPAPERATPTPAQPAPAPAESEPAPAPAHPAPVEPAPAHPAPVAPAPAEPVPAPPAVHYANCTEVREAGAAPIRQGEPGYSSKLDRDKDGIACDT